MSAIHDRTFAEVAPQFRTWRALERTEVVATDRTAIDTITALGILLHADKIDINGFRRQAIEALKEFGAEMFAAGYQDASGEIVG